MNSQITWFVSRSSGIVAWALVTLSVVWGLLLSARILGKRTSPAWMLDLHRFLGGLSVTFTAVHLAGLWADSFVDFGLTELFVPMASTWQPGDVAFGIVAMYILVAVELSSLLRRRLPRRAWRWVHHASVPMYAIATYHGIVAGTDSDLLLFKVVPVCSIAVVTLLLLVVLRSGRTNSRSAVDHADSLEITPL